MLSELFISNFTLIDQITLRFEPGLNIFTGATGVGKSLVIGALNFLLGNRATNEIIRTDKNEASVSAVCIIKNPDIMEKIKRIIDCLLDEEIILQRTLDQNGKNKCRFNNQPITVSILKEIGTMLINIHGQFENESLTDPSNQLDIFDRFGRLEGLRTKYSNIYKDAVEREKLLNSLKERQGEREKQIELCHFEINEIKSANLRPAEFERLEEERKILVNSKKIQDAISYCFNNLYESDNSIITRLKEVANELDKIKEIDKGFKDLVESCNQSIYQLEDVAQQLQRDIERFEFDPDRLEEVENRLETIRRLKKRYGNTIEAILTYCEGAGTRLEQLLKENEDIGSTEKELKALKVSAIKLGKELTRLRNKTGAELSKLVKKELTELGIPNGEFEVDITSIEITDEERFRLGDASDRGFDRVEFMFSANPGEKAKPLKKVASGGEMSRVMLAIKRQLALVDQTPVLVFDEIDANIGGRMGRMIGEKLKTVSQTHQTICITHLPQIASYADQHFKVNKSVENDRTFVNIDILSDESRLEEIAEMISGSEKTNVTRKQAKEMLEDAQRFRVKSVCKTA